MVCPMPSGAVVLCVDGEQESVLVPAPLVCLCRRRRGHPLVSSGTL